MCVSSAHFPEDFLPIDDDEAVVADSADGLRELAALRAECLEVRFLQFAVGMRHKLDLHAAPALREHVQGRHARIGVNHDQPLLRPADELDQERLRVPELVLIEDALQRRLLGLHEEIDLLFKGGDTVIMLGKAPVNLVFKLI